MQLQPFSQLRASQLAAVVALYREAFEAPWEWPAADVAALAHPAGATVRFWAHAALLHGDTAGFAIAEHLAQSNLWYLHYFAVAPALRGQGIGSWMLGRIIAAGEEAAARAGQAGSRGTMIEAETVGGPPPDADRRERERRHAFYYRHGAVPTGVRYPRPPTAPAHMPDWDILLIPGTAWEGALDRGTRQGLVRALAVEGYGAPPDACYLLDYLAAC